MNREMKKNARGDKRQFAHRMAEETDEAAAQNNTKKIYEITRILSGKKSTNASKPVLNKNGSVITDDSEQRSRWEEHFEEIFNQPPPTLTLDFAPTAEQLQVNTNPPTKAEIIKVIKSLNTDRWHSSRDIQSRPNSRSEDATPTASETLGTGASSSRLEACLSNQAIKKRRPDTVQGLAWDSTVVHFQQGVVQRLS
ncbi:hypothetical protein C0Q70_12363 [Pomacea canaliculata]|uniref:Uncharacterized protein n=1 Tax=Pomacea canaliculata TaxID=400727 RepID=A0A2T7P1B5_POMCA|nr:hypothetical protein C0Q70_12363 [Pomacea canaliculata]